jgi:predicted transcriptional regulator
VKRKTLSRTLRVRVDNATAERIRKLANREELPESQIVRRALRQFFETKEA